MSAGNKFCPQCGAPSTRSPSKLPLMIAVFLVLIAVAIAAILYRAAGSPAVSDAVDFPDVAPGGRTA